MQINCPNCNTNYSSPNTDHNGKCLMERLPCPKCGNKRGLDKSMRVGELEVSSEIFHPKIHFVHV